MLDGCVPWPAELSEEYRRAGYWSGRPLGELLAESCAANADRVAVVHGERRVTYGELGAASLETAGGLLALGIGPLDRVVVQLPNTPEFVVVVLALLHVGAIPVLALPGHRKSEITHLCGHSGAVAYVVKDVHGGFDHRELAREVLAAVPGVRHVVVDGDAAEFTALDSLRAGSADLPRVDPSQPALFLLSGGTTGLPKLIPRTHDDYAYNMLACARALEVDAGSVYLAVNPVAHNAALGCPGVLGTLLVGGRVVMAGGLRPDEAFALVRREGVTFTTLVPPLVRMWVEAAQKSGARIPDVLLQVGSSKFNPAEAERARKVLDCRLSQWFGVGEGLLTYTRITDADEVVLHTEGRPLADADEVRIAGPADEELPPGREGELLVRGPYTIRGYYRAPEQNARAFTDDGFFRTGDLAVRRADGNLVITGRIKDVINRVGDKVPAEEVERHLLAHPGIRDAAVVGVEDPVLGERCYAFVVGRGEELRAPALKAFLRGSGLATYKVPDRIVVLDAFPHTAVGKVDKGALRASVARG
ncbi:(2,3-dihydroxybenzoyl)adenylate synthase [Streptomyces sp. NPDC059816]|uniref:(2,3-dihydroxybenzoyl)adenylate synthase n=1 Tax=Streptomyces sp. NPDC059816 TaxID=3346960 RepID=UPI00364A5A62